MLVRVKVGAHLLETDLEAVDQAQVTGVEVLVEAELEDLGEQKVLVMAGREMEVLVLAVLELELVTMVEKVVKDMEVVVIVVA